MDADLKAWRGVQTTSKMTVKVEFLAGTSIESTIEEAKEKACFWDVAYVKFDFNGTSVSVRQNTDVKEGVDKWHKAIQNNGRYIIC